MTTAEQLRAMVEAATPGPWEASAREDSPGVLAARHWLLDMHHARAVADSRLIALAPSLAVALAEAVEALEATFDLAACSTDGDPWYAENAGIDVEATYAKARDALARVAGMLEGGEA